MKYIKGMKATLIQDITEYLEEIVPIINQIVDEYNYAATGVTIEEIIKWIIVRELWREYYLVYIGSHLHFNHYITQSPYLEIHHELNRRLRNRLCSRTLHHVKAFKMYDEHNEIDIEILGRDLYIRFYGDVCDQYNQIIGWK